MQNLYTTTRFMSEEEFKTIEAALRKAWCKETSFPHTRDKWSDDNKALGQCAVTALVIHDLFGGDFANDKEHNHIWNILPDGTEQDFSREQFASDIQLFATRVLKRGDVLDDEGAKKVATPERYEMLRKKFLEVYGS
jgi:hypothetical protein